MAYKKYLYINGKRFGPYYYESYRDENGKVRKKYMGTIDPNKKSSLKSFTPTLLIILGVIFIILLILIIGNLNYIYITKNNNSYTVSKVSNTFSKSVKFTGKAVYEEPQLDITEAQIDAKEKQMTEKEMQIAEQIADNTLESNIDIREIVDLKVKQEGNNKIMEFDTPQGLIKLSFDLLNYSEFVLKDSENEIETENLDINITESKGKYKWGYDIKLKDLNFMARIDVTTNQTINIIDNQTLKIGNNYLSFADLAQQGYILSINQPVVINEIITEENLTETNITTNLTQINLTICNMTNMSECNITLPVFNETISNETNITLPETNETINNTIIETNITSNITVPEPENPHENQTDENITLPFETEPEENTTETPSETPSETPPASENPPASETPASESSPPPEPEPTITANIIKSITGFFILGFKGIIGLVISQETQTIQENSVSVYVQRNFNEYDNNINIENITGNENNITVLENLDTNQSIELENKENQIINELNISYQDLDNNGKISIGDIIKLDPSLIAIMSDGIANESSEGDLTEWRMFRRWLNHTAWDGASYSTIPGLNNANFTTGQAVFSSPAVANGYVYVGSQSNSIYQLNAGNITQQIASFTTGNDVDSSPAVANGYVYVGSSDNIFYQLNASNISKEVTNFTTGGAIAISSPAIANGYVYIGSYDYTVYQLNASNISQQIANFTTGASIESSPAIANGYVYIGSGDGKIYQLNASNISQQINNYNIGSVVYSPAVANGYAYVGSNDGKLYQLNASNISVGVAIYVTGSNIFYSSPAIANGYVYIGSYDYTVYQLNASNISQQISNYTTGDNIGSSPAVADGYVYIGSKDKSIYQLNASNISQYVSNYTTGNYVISSPAIANGYVYVGSYDNKIYQLNASNISLMNNFPINLTQISNCTILNSSNTIYTQVANIIANQTPCINITAINVTFNGNGFWIINRTLNGDAVVSSAKNSTIKNCNISMSASGIGIILYSGSNNSYIFNNTLSNQERGIWTYSSNHIIYKNNILNNTYAVYSASLNNSDFNENTIDRNSYGIYLTVSLNNTFRNNLILNNTQIAAGIGVIYLGTSTSDYISNNTFYFNKNYPFSTITVSSKNLIFINNHAENNTVGFLFYGDNFTISNNTANYNCLGGGTSYGFYFNPISNSSITNNIANNMSPCTGGYGFYFWGSKNNILDNNTANYNDYGFYFTAGNNNTLKNLVADFNTVDGAYIDDDNLDLINISANNNLGQSAGNSGIYILADNISIENAIVNNNSGNGIWFQGSNIIIKDSIVNNNSNGNGGIYSSATSNKNITLINNIANLNAIGVHLKGSNITVINNTVNNNSDSGIKFSTVSNCLIANITSSNNKYGINFASSSINISIFNGTLDNNQNAIYSLWLTNSTFENLIINNSRNDAIYLYRSTFYSDNIFKNITILNTNSSWYDIKWKEVTNGETINGTTLIDMPYIGNYTFVFGASDSANTLSKGGATIRIIDSRYGEILFINTINGSGTNFSDDIKIGNNSVHVNSSKTGLNRTVNITLYNLPSFIYPKIFRNDINECNSTTTPSCWNFTNLSSGNVIFNVSSWTNYTIKEADTTSPIINITHPLNINYTSNVSAINYTISDNVGVSSCWYSNNSGVWNSTSQSAGTNFTNLSSIEGWNNWTVYCNDTSRNLNSSFVRFFKDTIVPRITIISPLNQTYNSSFINFNVSSDEALDYCKFTINNWLINYTMILNSSLTGANYTNSSVPDGNYLVKFQCNDIYGNINNTRQMNFSVDTTPPTITFSCSPTSVSSGGTISCSCSAIDNLDASPVVSYTANPSTSTTGTFSTTCTATDASGNSASFSVSYSVSSGGGGGGGCTTIWQCTEYGECINGKQSRNCTNLGTCLPRSKTEEKACNVSTKTIEPIEIPSTKTPTGYGCENWSECRVTYSLEDVIQGNFSLSGEQTALCNYTNEIKTIVTRKCKTRIPIKTKKVTWCYKNYLEIYDLNDTLISKIEIFNNTYKILNVEISLNNLSYCPYCYNRLKDYDEDETDCMYKENGSCPVCIKEIPKKEFPWWIFILILIMLLYLIFVTVSKKGLEKREKFFIQDLHSFKFP